TRACATGPRAGSRSSTTPRTTPARPGAGAGAAPAGAAAAAAGIAAAPEVRRPGLGLRTKGSLTLGIESHESDPGRQCPAPSRASARVQSPAMHERIVVNPKVCHGKPVIKGTRVPVVVIVGSLAGGMTYEEVMREYGIELEDIHAALRYAAEMMQR